MKVARNKGDTNVMFKNAKCDDECLNSILKWGYIYLEVQRK